MHLLPPLGARDGAITREGPGAAGRGRGAGDAAEDGQHHEGNEQGDGTARGPDGGLDDGGRGLAGGQGDQHGEVGQHKHERHQKQQAADRVDENGDDHGLWHLGGGMLHLFAHADDHTGGRRGVSSMEQADTEGPARRPAGGGLKPAEGIVSRPPPLLGDGEDGDENGEEAGKGPKNGKGLPTDVSVSGRKWGRLAARTSRICR